MFSGMYTQQLDGKGRLRLPAKIREELGESFVLTKGMNDTIAIYPQSVCDEMCARYMTYDQDDPVVQSVIAELTSWMRPAKEDSQGRFVIPENYLKLAGIDKNVVIKGVLNRIEIWSEERHENRATNLSVNELMAVLKKAGQNG